jgi:predicted acetyltransferase
MKIRQIEAAERQDVSVPVQAYAFQPSPATPEVEQRLKGAQQYYQENVTLVAEDDGVSVAEVSAIPMDQNVRGGIYRMAGVAGVATLPLARRRGYASALMWELLGRMRDMGYAVSALYPFHPSFYQRFGYVGLPKVRTVTFSPNDLADLVHTELPGKVTWERSGEGYGRYREFTSRLLAECHGFALLPEYRAVELRDSDDRWLAAASTDDDEMLASVTYRISRHGGDLLADDLLTRSPLGRALLLQVFASHANQVNRVVVTVPPWEFPELWKTDLATVTQAAISFPVAPAPMARVLSLDRLAGMPAGPGQVTVEVVGDRFISGRYSLDGTSGVLDVTSGAQGSEATLTAAGMSGLIYGVLDPDDVVVRGFGEVPAEVASRLRVLFPRQVPYLFASF